MDGQKKYSPYRGMWAVVLVMIAVPLVLTVIIESTLAIVQPHYTVVNRPSARFVGCGLGFLFHVVLFFSGVYRESLEAVKYRISEFFENAHCSLGFALSCYLSDMKQDGVVFDVYFGITLGTLVYSLYNLQLALKLLRLI